ncbi:MAG: hypothetical protein AAB344_00540, partial [Bacteroidota bacterium]
MMMRMRRTTYAAILMCGVSMLVARALSQITIVLPHEGAVSAFSNQSIVGQSIPGMPVRLEVNGVTVDSGEVRLDGVFEFLGVPCPRGPVTLKTTVRMKNGNEYSAERNMHIF